VPALTVNGAELYYEIRGSGPPVLFIMGATGDAGHFATVADALGDEFTVATYDRRGNSRSPVPPGWSTTSVEEQAEDAAALLQALELAPAAIFGNSSGAIYALDLLIRHPEAARGVILHEPPLLSLLERPEEVQTAIGALLEGGMEAGGPPQALERFWRFVAGDANWEDMESGLRERILRNAETFLDVEMGTFEDFRPDDATLAAVATPVQVLLSEQSAPFFAEIAESLGERLGAEISHTPGTHTPYDDHPLELVQTIRPFLREVSG
jgi:pimeloyl-ACP methyl ester carboxylesterase